jgi:hypothetical protein
VLIVLFPSMDAMSFDQIYLLLFLSPHPFLINVTALVGDFHVCI